VSEAIAAYRRGGRFTTDDQLAWLSVALTSLQVRDDAWARMDMDYRDLHRRLWTDVVRRAEPQYVPAPASLLAFTAWQSGNGALANVALERALEADPSYSMALLLRDVMDAGAPPSMARLPMTPEEVAASYAAAEEPDTPDNDQRDTDSDAGEPFDDNDGDGLDEDGHDEDDQAEDNLTDDDLDDDDLDDDLAGGDVDDDLAGDDVDDDLAGGEPGEGEPLDGAADGGPDGSEPPAHQD
jgi:hypothetical protein